MRRKAFFATIIVCFRHMRENIEITRLENGLTILTDRMPDVRSITLGFFFRRGARHEPAQLNGLS